MKLAGVHPIFPKELYQTTTTLPAANYSFEWEWDGVKEGMAFFVVAQLDALPDFDAVEENALSYSPFSSGIVEFTLAERSEVLKVEMG